MKLYISGIIGLFVAYFRRFWRDKSAMFFTFLFPLIFLFVFGTIFNNNSVSFRVALINHADNEFARNFVDEAKKDDKTIKVQSDVTTLDEAKKKMSRGELDSIIELPKDFGHTNERQMPSGTLNVYYQKGSEQSGKTLAAVMQQVLDGINKQLGYQEPTLKVAEVSSDTSGASNFDYIFSGLLGFSLMSMGIFGLANAMPEEKQKGAFARLRAHR